MPSGNIRTGRKIPIRPGSSGADEVSTGNGADIASGIVSGRAARTSARSLNQPIPQISSARSVPAAHSTISNMIQFVVAPGTTLAAGALAKGAAVFCSTSSAGPSGSMGTTGNVTAPPRTISTENGTRNLTDAANHSQKRNEAA